MNELKNATMYPPNLNKKVIAEIQRHLDESSVETDINRKIEEYKKQESQPLERKYKFEINQTKNESQDIKK
jgi:hypothetical protein